MSEARAAGSYHIFFDGDTSASDPGNRERTHSAQCGFPVTRWFATIRASRVSFTVSVSIGRGAFSARVDCGGTGSDGKRGIGSRVSSSGGNRKDRSSIIVPASQPTHSADGLTPLLAPPTDFIA